VASLKLTNFFDAEGEFDAKKLRSYLYRHKDSTEVALFKKLPGETYKEKYLYMKNHEEPTLYKESQKLKSETDFETGKSVSEALLAKDTTDEKELLELHGFDTNLWKVTKSTSSLWENGKDTLVASKIWVEPRNLKDYAPEQIMKTIDKAVNFKPEDLKVEKIENHGRLLVLPIADLHYGLLSDYNTSGNRYDMKIAEERLKAYVTDATSRAVKSGGADSVLLTLGNDFFNADNVFGTTTKGTRQDNEAGHFTVFDAGVHLAVTVIEFLRKAFKNVYVLSVQGNHDKQSSHALMAALYYKYSGVPFVDIDLTSDEYPRTYFKFGQNLLGFGHETKIKEVQRIMSNEAEDWSSCKFKTFFLGHLHHEEVLDVGPLVVRRLPVMSGRSAWSAEMGFECSPRAQAFVFDSANGLEEIFNKTF